MYFNYYFRWIFTYQIAKFLCKIFGYFFRCSLDVKLFKPLCNKCACTEIYWHTYVRKKSNEWKYFKVPKWNWKTFALNSILLRCSLQWTMLHIYNFGSRNWNGCAQQDVCNVTTNYDLKPKDTQMEPNEKEQQENGGNVKKKEMMRKEQCMVLPNFSHAPTE